MIYVKLYYILYIISKYFEMKLYFGILQLFIASCVASCPFPSYIRDSPCEVNSDCMNYGLISNRCIESIELYCMNNDHSFCDKFSSTTGRINYIDRELSASGGDDGNDDGDDDDDIYIENTGSRIAIVITAITTPLLMLGL